MRQRSVSSPRSSSRTCRFPTSGSSWLHAKAFGVSTRCGGRASLFRGYQAHRQSLLPSTPLQARQRQGVLPSTGITRPHRSYSPLRLPDRPPPCGAFGSRSRRTGSPLSPIDRSPTCRCHYPVDRKGASVDPFPVRAAFPELGAGRRPRLRFRGLLGNSLALPACPIARPPSRRRRASGTTRPLSRGFDTTGCPAAPLVSFRCLSTPARVGHLLQHGR